MSNEVEEKLIFRNAEDLVSYLDKEAEALARDEVELVHQGVAQVAGPCRGLHEDGLETRRGGMGPTSSVSSGK